MKWLHLKKNLTKLFDAHIIIINPLQNYLYCPYFKYNIKVKWHETYVMVLNLGVTRRQVSTLFPKN